jgi:hypothetical protein
VTAGRINLIPAAPWPVCPDLRFLSPHSLDDNNIDDEAAIAFAEVLKHNKSLTTLK